jgi:anthranilate synthase component 1
MTSRNLFQPQPSFSEFVSLSKRYDRIPVALTIHSDLETPLTAYLKLGGHEGSFLLESVEKNEKVARYSVVGYDPCRVFTSRDGVLTEKVGAKVVGRYPSPNPLSYLKVRYAGNRQAPLPGGSGFSGGLVGFLSYDIVRRFEHLPEKAADTLGLPDLSLLEIDQFALFDHVTRTLRLVANVVVGKGVNLKASYDQVVRRLNASVRKLESPLRNVPELPLPGKPSPSDPLLGFKSNMVKAKFLANVRKCQEYIKAGDIIQVVPSQRFEKETTADAVTVYRLLRRLNPSPYMFLLRFAGMDLVGASPEMLLKVQDGVVETRPIAGTRPRGADEKTDLALEEGLLKDPKELAEHVMLVDLGRNDLGRVCEYGTVKVEQFQRIERYSHVMHIVSDVTGRLAKGLTAFDAFQSCFPAGTLSGAPKIRAMEIIEELEPTRRGAYGGAVVIAGYDGNLDSAITIRSLVLKVDAKGKRRAYVQAGGGVVADSVPENEYQETCNKAKAVMLAVAAAEGMVKKSSGRGRKRPQTRKSGKGR